MFCISLFMCVSLSNYHLPKTLKKNIVGKPAHMKIFPGCFLTKQVRVLRIKTLTPSRHQPKRKKYVCIYDSQCLVQYQQQLISLMLTNKQVQQYPTVTWMSNCKNNCKYYVLTHLHIWVNDKNVMQSTLTSIRQRYT